MENLAERRIPVYRLLPHKEILKPLLSFSFDVERCNFTTVAGWWMGKGRTYVKDHNVDEYKPIERSLRGRDLLDVFDFKLTDSVVLTEEQYADYNVVIGL